MARDQEHSGGFTISFYNQDVIESNAEDSYGPRGDKEHRKNAMRAGFTDAGGGITEKGWGQLNKDIAIMERNSVAWLKKKFVNARDEGHGGHGGDELIGTVWYDTSNPEQAHLLLLGVNDRIDMTDLSYGDLGASVWKGVSPFGSVLGGAINFFDIPDSDLEKAEETEGRRKRSSKR